MFIQQPPDCPRARDELGRSHLEDGSAHRRRLYASCPLVPAPFLRRPTTRAVPGRQARLSPCASRVDCRFASACLVLLYQRVHDTEANATAARNLADASIGDDQSKYPVRLSIKVISIGPAAPPYAYLFALIKSSVRSGRPRLMAWSVGNRTGAKFNERCCLQSMPHE